MKSLLSNFPLVAVAACLFVIGTLFPRTGCAEEAAMSELEELVGPVALYPDDLLSIVLPASTVPLQIVEADRWIRQNKGNAKAVPKDSWDDAVKSLINYPDVVAMMNEDLDWTSALGEAVATDPEAVMDAVQSFRRRAEGAGNLKSDDKQTVVVEKEVVKIVQTDPQIIYVPQYQPQTVIVYQTVPVYPTYYPTPYPVYYYPYPPGHHFAAGFFWGAATAYAFDWHGGHIHNDIDIDIDRNVNINRTDINNRATNIDRDRSRELARNNNAGWKSDRRPADVRSGRVTAPSTQRNVASRPTGSRPEARPGGAGGGPSASREAKPAATSRPGSATQPRHDSSSRYQQAARHSGTARSAPPSRDAFSGMSNGRTARAQSQRGAMSRSAGRPAGGARRR
jgi:hypothetical protein